MLNSLNITLYIAKIKTFATLKYCLKHIIYFLYDYRHRKLGFTFDTNRLIFNISKISSVRTYRPIMARFKYAFSKFSFSIRSKKNPVLLFGIMIPHFDISEPSTFMTPSWGLSIFQIHR